MLQTLENETKVKLVKLKLQQEKQHQDHQVRM